MLGSPGSAPNETRRSVAADWIGILLSRPALFFTLDLDVMRARRVAALGAPPPEDRAS